MNLFYLFPYVYTMIELSKQYSKWVSLNTGEMSIPRVVN